jgi:cysteine-rich repeat protein
MAFPYRPIGSHALALSSRCERGPVRSLVVGIGLAVSVALLGCSSQTTDLFGSVGGSGGAGTTGTQSTGSKSTGSQSTVSVTTGSQTTVSVTTGAETTTVSSSSGGPLCGNGVIDGNEECDGADLNGHDCTDQGFANPAGATCSATCHIKYTGCNNVCGNGVVEPGEQCDDQNTNAFDACSNTCESQGTCATAIPVALGLGTMELDADTSGMSHFTSTGCAQATGPELVYSVSVTHAGFFTAWTDPFLTDYDSMVYARVGNNCATAAEVACGDNTPQEPDLLSIPVQANEVIYLFVDGFAGNNQSGHFDLHLDLSAGTCADPVPILVGDGGSALENAHGTTEGQGADGTGTCGGLGQDVVYAITRVSQGSVKETTTPNGATPYHSVTHARTSCTDATSEVACNNDPVATTSTITVNNVDTTTPTYVWVDGTASSFGPYIASFGP